jgi:hypothetical protein
MDPCNDGLNDGLDNKIDEMLSLDITTRIASAKADLEARMAELGLSSRDGWKIQEELRDTETGTRWVFRPVHLRRDAPDLHSSVTLDRAGRAK